MEFLKMVEALDRTADLVRVSISTNIVAGACWRLASPPANSVDFFSASCLLHFSVQLYKLDGIAGTGIAVAAKAAKGVGFGVNL